VPVIRRSIWLLPAALALAVSMPARADDAVAAAGPEVPERDAVDRALASTRQGVREITVWLARGIDSWFGDLPFEDGGGVQGGRLSLSLGTRQGEDPDVNLRFSVQARLPNVERQGYLFLGRDDPREVVSDRPEEASRQQLLLRQQQAADPSFFAGFGLTVQDAVDFRVGFRGGLKPYVQARYRKTWTPSSDALIEFRETLFWSVDDRFGSTTTASASHAFTPTLAGRWLNSATITQDSGRFEWSSILGSYQALGRQRLLSFELILSGEEDTGVPVSDYGLQLRWEQPVHEDWLLLEVGVGHFWPREDPQSPRGREWALGATLKLLF